MRCYICHRELNVNNTHSHYRRMCKTCGDFNEEKRNELSNLSGYTALVTGGRIKIGYETSLKLLRSGAFVVVTTRFPVDAVKRYSLELDFNNWYQRLRVYQIDFRQLTSLYDLVHYIKIELGYLDILINNAAQTVRHTYSYFCELYNSETESFKSLSEKQKQLIVFSNNENKFDYLQQSFDRLLPMVTNKLPDYIFDNTPKKNDSEAEIEKIDYIQFQKNSWISKACDVSLVEMLEVQLINVTAPYFLCTQARSLMVLSPHRYKYVVNVSAMEGQFNKYNKNCFHPHTNMAKASLNMFTRTSAQEFIDDGILMNSVDTGWITDENPDWLRDKNERKGLFPPLDAKDGASRLCDPIFASINRKHHEYGSFIKDYKRTGW